MARTFAVFSIFNNEVLFTSKLETFFTVVLLQFYRYIDYKPIHLSILYSIFVCLYMFHRNYNTSRENDRPRISDKHVRPNIFVGTLSITQDVFHGYYSRHKNNCQKI